MKKIVVFIICGLAFCNILFAQSKLSELDKVKEIKLLESTREDVEKILADDSLVFYSSSDYHFQDFFMMNANVRIFYSSGKCSEEYEDWNVAEWKVTEIRVSPKDFIGIEDTGIDYSKFKKEEIWGSIENDYAYHDKASGIAITVRGAVVESINFFPSKENYSLLCDKAEVKKYYSGKKWNRYPEQKKAIIDLNGFADVIRLDLSRTEIINGCDSSEAAQNKNCSDDDKKIAITTVAEDPENDPLTYFYKVSGGKIIGSGAKVVWDLSDVKAGTYTITAAANDGCGLCGKYITKTIIVKECADCSPK